MHAPSGVSAHVSLLRCSAATMAWLLVQMVELRVRAVAALWRTTVVLHPQRFCLTRQMPCRQAQPDARRAGENGGCW